MVALSYTVDPGRGVGDILLGMSQDEAARIIGEPESRYRTYHGDGVECAWDDSRFQVTFDASHAASEIMVCWPAKATFREVSLLDTPAESVVATFADLGGVYEEDGYMFVLPDHRLALWRQVLAGDEPDDDPQTRGGRYWDTVTIWR
jgi:hypothetical protein